MPNLLKVTVPRGQLAQVLDTLEALEAAGAVITTVTLEEPQVKWTARVLLDWIGGPYTEEEALDALREDLGALQAALDRRLWRLTVNDDLSLDTLEPWEDDPDAAALLAWRRRHMPREE